MVFLLSLAFLQLSLVAFSRGNISDEILEKISADARRAYIADFEDVARRYVEQKGREYGRRVSWWDIHGKHQHIRERPQYHHYKIEVEVDRVSYGTVSRTVDRPGYVYSQWFHNAHGNPLIGEMSKTVERATSFTWTIEEGLKLGTEVTVSAGVPEVFGASVSVSAEISLQASQSHTTSETESFTISNTITVSPQTSTKAEWTINEREMDVPWEADVYIDGWVAIWFDEQYDGHWLWFHPIYMLAGGPFKQYGNGIRYRAKGIFKGVRGLESVLKTYEYPLQTGYGMVLGEPRNVTVVERKRPSPFKHGSMGD